MATSVGLGDRVAVAQLLRIVSGERAGVPAPVAQAVEHRTREGTVRMERVRAIDVERTPRVIRALRDEGIIARLGAGI